METVHADDAPSLAGSTRITEASPAEVIARDLDGRHIIEATLIRSGLSRNGYTYSPATLQQSAHLFEGARAFVDHNRNDALPERSVRDLVGAYRNARFSEGKLKADLHLVPGNDWLFHLLKEAEGNPTLCGLSIDAWADVDPRTKAVAPFRKVESVDIVTRPSAGGQLDRVLMSDIPTSQETTMDSPTATNPASADVGTSQAEGVNPAPELAHQLRQTQSENADLRRQLESITAGQAHPPNTLPESRAELARLAQEIRTERDLARCQTQLSVSLEAAHLPEPVDQKLRRQFAGRVFETEALDGVIAEEKDVLAALSSAGAIRGMGYEKPVTMGMLELDQTQAAIDGLFGIYESEDARRLPRLTGIREAFYLCTGVDVGNAGSIDRPLRESLRYQLQAKYQNRRLAEAELHIQEADVTTASFSYLLGTSMNKRLMMDYLAWPSEWQKFCNVVAIKDFKLQNRIRLGAFGSLSTVAEDAGYTTLSLADTQATYTATKRGNLVQITRETIINDDLYAIKQIPQKLAVAAAFTLAEFVYNLMAPSYGAIYDGHNLFDSINHLNTGIVAASLGTANSGAALTSAALATAVVKMRKQQNAASKPIGLKPRFLLAPPDLEFTAMTILKSAGLPGGNNNDINPMMGYAEPIVSPQLNNLTAGPASTTIWIAVADPRVIDTIEVGFVGGQANPVLLIQDLPLYGLNFTQDVISYKVRHEYGGAVVDYRGFYLGNN